MIMMILKWRRHSFKNILNILQILSSPHFICSMLDVRGGLACCSLLRHLPCYALAYFHTNVLLHLGSGKVSSQESYHARPSLIPQFLTTLVMLQQSKEAECWLQKFPVY